MAQNISLLGATYQNCPAVLLPKSGGGTARFDDATITTAQAADVASGKLFLAADGTITTGTSSGGGGASNYVHGEFTTSTTKGTLSTVTIPYTGSGWPILAVFTVKGGMYNNGDGGDLNWYNKIQRYAVGLIVIQKNRQFTAPDYGSASTAQNLATVASIYKNSTSSATSYTRTSSTGVQSFYSGDASNGSTTCVRFKSATNMTVYVASNSFGLLDSTTYEYFIVYSS